MEAKLYKDDDLSEHRRDSMYFEIYEEDNGFKLLISNHHGDDISKVYCLPFCWKSLPNWLKSRYIRRKIKLTQKDALFGGLDDE